MGWVVTGGIRRWGWLAPWLSLLAGCAAFGPLGPEHRPPATPSASAFIALAPHGGERSHLSAWWRQFDDPVLVELIDAAQQASASLAQAASRIVQAQSVLAQAGATVQPALDAAASRTRGPVSFGGPLLVRTQDLLQLQSSWEIDLFGARLREREAGTARLGAREAEWHDARVAVAAEVASQYLALRACEYQRALESADWVSRGATARLTRMAAAAGFQSGADLAIAQADVEEQAARLQAQRAECDLLVKALVAISDLDEIGLRARLAAGAERLPAPRGFVVEVVPAQLVAQRPDLAAAERELAAASAEIGVAIADRYPRMALSGAIGPLRFDAGTVSLSAMSWSLGPSLSVPLFDGGRRQSAQDAARARHQAADAVYREKVRQAIREVEQALVRLGSAARREAEIGRAAQGYQDGLAAVQSRRAAGLASDLALEQARRAALQVLAMQGVAQRERVSAWIALYRALGGGWTAAEPVRAASH